MLGRCTYIRTYIHVRTEVRKMEAIERWVDHLRRGEHTSRSLYSMRIVVENFVRAIGPKEFYTCEDVKQYLATLERKGLAGSSRQAYYRLIKSFFKANGWGWTLDTFDAPKKSPPRREFLSPNEAALLLEAAKDRPTLYMALRLAIMLGSRRGELLLLRRSEYKRPRIFVHVLKHGVSGWRKLDPDTCDVIEWYMKVRPTPSDVLLVNDDGAPTTWLQLEYQLKRLLDRLGLHRRQLGWHAIRRGLVTWLYDRGTRESAITKIIGWAKPTTVHDYIQLDREKEEEKALKKHPLLNNK